MHQTQDMKSKSLLGKMGIKLGKTSVSEEDNIHFSENNEHEKLNVGSEEQIDNYEPNKITNRALTEAIHAPIKVHQFYFVKVWPHQIPESKLEIEKAEKLIRKLIRKLNHLELQLTKTLEIQVIKSTKGTYSC
ncbi:hypothetical protein CsatB_020599 [Cannabis sativa]